MFTQIYIFDLYYKSLVLSELKVGMPSIFPESLQDGDLLKLLKLSIELSEASVLWIKSDSEIIYVNNAACEKLGYSQQELIGKCIWQWFPIFSEDAWAIFWKDLKEKKTIDIEIHPQNKAGETFSVRIKGQFIEHGEEELLFANVADISSVKKHELKPNQQSQKLKALVKSETAQLEQEKKTIETFVNLAPIGIAINRLEDGVFEYINTEFCRLTGYNVDELNQMDYWALTPQKYKEQEQEQLISLTNTGKYGPYQKEYIHKKGHVYPVLLSGIKIIEPDGKECIWSIVQDMSQQKEVEKQIQIAKEKADSTALRMKLANDSAGIGIWEWDLVANVLIWDDWMYRLYGVSEDKFSGAYEAWENSVHPDDIADAKAKLESAIAGVGVYEPEFRVVHPDGQVRTMKASAEILRDNNGKALKVIGVNYDITYKVDAINSLAKAKKEAEKANQAKSDFLANMSHEIRTPMNAILGGLQLLQNTQLDDKLKTILDNSTYSAKTLLTILNDILDYSKIEEQKLDLEQEPFSLVEVLDSVKYDLDSLASNKGIDFRTVIDDSFVDGWVGDLVRVKQVLLNITSNAVKFTNKGYVKVELSCAVYDDKNAICIKVFDTGIGMTEEAQNRIFERFSQADTSTTRKFGGTGLGMSITISLVQMMKGSIDLTSSLGEGTNISVILPLKQTRLSPKGEKKKSLSAPKMAGKRILIAEDNEINQVVIQSMLGPTEADLTIVENGKLALDAVAKMDFDLILMDIQMPEMDGVEAQQKIKEMKSTIPIIALTANVMVEDVKDYLDKGFTAHLAKPVDMRELYGLLSRYKN